MADNFLDTETDPLDPQSDKVDEANLQIAKADREKQARIILENRINAYRRVFKEGTPSREDREIVLSDLEQFCRYNQSAYTDSERLTNLLLGRQEVALRIHEHLRLSVDDMLTLRT